MNIFYIQKKTSKSFLFIIIILPGSFVTTASAQTIVNSFTPLSGPVGSTVTINGTGFNPVPSGNVVYFGSVKATVTSASPTSLMVIVPLGSLYVPITVTNIVNGFTGYSRQIFDVTFPTFGAFSASSFAPKVDFAAPSRPGAVCVGDFDGDGRPDMATVEYASNLLSVYPNASISGNLAFLPRINYPTGVNPPGTCHGRF
jgi:IPT/TIG domain